jgi:aminoglycoside 3-N-acetyltransferase I
MQIERLGNQQLQIAQNLFSLMASVFEEESLPLPDSYVQSLLDAPSFWALAAWDQNQLIGGLTAHTIPLTRIPAREVFIYDLAVLLSHQRQGVGRQLVNTLRTLAAPMTVFVPADNEDQHALDFYRAIGGDPAEVTIFTFES